MTECLPTEEIAPKITILNGFAFPSSGFSDTGGLPLVRIRDLDSSTTETHFRGRFDQRYVLKDGDLLIGMDGDFNVVRWTGGKALLNQRVCKVEARPGAIDPGFLYYSLQPKIAEVHRRTPQTTVRHLSTKAVERIELPTIGLNAQRRIAEVLDTAEDAVRSTERLIAKLEQMKQGMLHDVLTRGIDDNGELRDPSSHPEQFDEASAGPLPRSWSFADVGGEFDVRSGITLGPEREPGRNASPYLRVANVYRGRLALDDVARLQASAGERAEYSLRVNDLLVVEGHANPHEIGRCAIVTEPAAGFLYQNHLFRLRAKSMVPEFSELWLNSPTIRSYWHRICSSSSGLNTINSKQLKAAPVAIPHRDEQEAIVRTCESASREIAEEEIALDKLRALKAGLMDDLLTGRVRVNVDNEDAA